MMAQIDYFTLLTLQSAEGQQEACMQLLKHAFDDPLVPEAHYYCSDEDPEILLAIHGWSSPGAFEEYMRKIQDHEIMKKNSQKVEFVQITRWKTVKQ